MFNRWNGPNHFAPGGERAATEHNGAGVPFEYTGAYLLGVDGQTFLDPHLSDIIARVLDRFVDSDADVVVTILRERGRILVEDEDRLDVFEHFLWYRRGVGL